LTSEDLMNITLLGSRPRRIHVIGGSGTGKSDLANQIAARLGVPIYHLDEIARTDGGLGSVRPLEERVAAVKRIVDEPTWVTEGIHLQWTDPLLEAADAIVWLDHISWHEASRRIIGRFLRLAVHEVRIRRGRERFARFDEYRRHLRALLGAVRDARTYYASEAVDEGRDSDGESWRATSLELGRYRAKVVRCTTRADIDAVITWVIDRNDVVTTS
jgi:adenylate kinase family enzyme